MDDKAQRCRSIPMGCFNARGQYINDDGSEMSLPIVAVQSVDLWQFAHFTFAVVHRNHAPPLRSRVSIDRNSAQLSTGI
jgi:hypothetical protein